MNTHGVGALSYGNQAGPIYMFQMLKKHISSCSLYMRDLPAKGSKELYCNTNLWWIISMIADKTNETRKSQVSSNILTFLFVEGSYFIHSEDTYLHSDGEMTKILYFRWLSSYPKEITTEVV